MLPFSLLLLAAGVACIAFGVRLALNLGGAAERAAARNRAYRPPVAILGSAYRGSTYRPKSTRGMRLGGGVFVLAGLIFFAVSALLASFPKL